MSKMLENWWPKDESEDTLLDFIATFKPLSLYFVGFCKYC